MATPSFHRNVFGGAAINIVYEKERLQSSLQSVLGCASKPGKGKRYPLGEHPDCFTKPSTKGARHCFNIAISDVKIFGLESSRLLASATLYLLTNIII